MAPLLVTVAVAGCRGGTTGTSPAAADPTPAATTSATLSLTDVEAAETAATVPPGNGQPGGVATSPARATPRSTGKPAASVQNAPRPPAATTQAPPIGIHGTLYVNPDSTHGIGTNPSPTDVPQQYSSPLSATLERSPNPNLPPDPHNTFPTCEEVNPGHCIGDAPTP